MTGSARTVLVTGATGFIGRAVVPVLAEAGWQVRANGRDASRAPAQCEFIASDLHEASFDGLTRGVDAVVHLAARVHVMHETQPDAAARYRALNFESTLALAEAARRNGVRHFVFASSVKVNGEWTADHPWTESDSPKPSDPYGESKWMAEQALARLSQATGLAVTVLRFPLVYGPEAKGNFERMARWVRRGWPLPLAGIDNRRSLLFVGNLASAVVVALERPAEGCRTYFVSDGEDVSTTELLRRVAKASGTKARLIAVPGALLRSLAAMAGRTAEWQRLTRSLAIDSGRLRRELGWQPRFSLEEALRITLRPAEAETPLQRRHAS